MLTIDKLKALVPKKLKTMITDNLVDTLNNAANDPKIIEEFKENFISYLNVLSDGKYKMTDYINAVKFVSYKLLDYSDLKAYIATFPDRFDRLKEEGVADIAPYASMYKKNKLVTQIFEQTIIPSHVLNAPIHQEAINTLREIMLDPDQRGLTRVKAGEALLNATKQPENTKIKMDIAVRDIDAISELKVATENLAKIQLEQLRQGSIGIKQIAENNIIDIEIDEDIVEDRKINQNTLSECTESSVIEDRDYFNTNTPFRI